VNSKAAKLDRVDKAKVIALAWEWSVIKGRSFTAPNLAKTLNMPPNRHLRRILNDLALAGLLKTERPLCADGYYRKYYFSNHSQARIDLKGIMEKTA
jgi:hypothetical protein